MFSPCLETASVLPVAGFSRSQLAVFSGALSACPPPSRGHQSGGIHGPCEAVPGEQLAAKRITIASHKRAPDPSSIGSGAGIHHADGCGDEQLQGEGVTAW